MRMRSMVAGGLVVLACLASGAMAQDKLEVRDADTIRSVLERHVGKRVTLVMHSGPDLTGVVVKVGERLVHLDNMPGREFFDAVVSLDRVTGVVVRVRR